MGTSAFTDMCQDNIRQSVIQEQASLMVSFWQKVQSTSNILKLSYSAQKLREAQLKFTQLCSNVFGKTVLALGPPKNSSLYYHSGQFIYGGDIQNGYFQGNGIIVHASGKTYIGEFKAGKYVGKGQFIFICEMRWKQTELKIQTNRSQSGILGAIKMDKVKGLTFELKQNDLKKKTQKFVKYKNGDEYLGEWHEGFPHGFGKYVYKNGSERSDYPYYEGQFVKGRREGKGTLHYDSKKKLYINWIRDKPFGDGELSIDNYKQQVTFNCGKRVYNRVSLMSQQ